LLSTRRIVRGFLRGLSNSRVALAGAVITLTLFPVLVLYSTLDGFDIVESPKLSFIVYGVLTWVFLAGHLMVFTGLYVLRNRRGTTLFAAEEFRDCFEGSDRFGSIRRLILFVTSLTFINFSIIGAAAYNGFLYSESVAFCAELCHDVMLPEFTAYGNSPHSRVECVECHIGEGATWFVQSKLSGIRQLAAVALDMYSRPIETPIHGLRPARETCEECHRPELFHGDRLKVVDRYLEDEDNTLVRSVLLMNVGSGGGGEKEGFGSHWHVSEGHRIVYEHTDRKRVDIPRVRLVRRDGSEIVYQSESGSGETPVPGDGGSREMDCLDCHNRPTHVYLAADEVLDLKLGTGEIPPELPFIKRQAMELIQAEYPDRDAATAEISASLSAWYIQSYPDLLSRDPSLVERAVRGVSAAYTENVFPEMGIGFGTYERHLGHLRSHGCFRCHDDSHETRDGGVIRQDCDLCHRILATDVPVEDFDPFEAGIDRAVLGTGNLR
jgi:hypothetical protein